MNDKITIEKEGRSITIEDEEKSHLDVVSFTLSDDNLTVEAVEGCDDYVTNYLSKKDMTYLISHLTAMRDMMVEEDEDLEEVCVDINTKAKQILDNPFDYVWEIQGFGMLRTYIDKNTRLQIWLNKYIVPNVTDIHTHPWDFESYIYQGEITNNCYLELFPIIPSIHKGYEYDRCLILTGENAYVKEKTKVSLIDAIAVSYTQGDKYKHDMTIPHRIDFIDGTVTILTKKNIQPDSLAYSYVVDGGEWVSAAPRLATKEEVNDFILAYKKLKENNANIR